MKKISISSSILLLLTGCAAELESGDSIVDRETMTVTFDPVTRVYFDSNQQTVWNEEDSVSVFYKQHLAEKWTYIGTDGASSGAIRRSEVKYGNGIDHSVIIYPYSPDYTINISGKTVSAVFPSAQHYKENSFGEGGNIMIAESEDNSFTMKSVAGWLKLHLVGDATVGKIVLTGNDESKDIISGPMNINYETLAVNFVSGENSGDSEAGRRITLDCGSGVALSQTPTDFYIALPPHTFASGLTVALEDTDGTLLMTKSTGNSVEIKRSHILPMQQFTVESTPALASFTSTSQLTSITLNASWDSAYSSVITNVKYRVSTTDGTAVSSGYMDISGNSATVTIPNLTPGYYYNIGVCPCVGETECAWTDSYAITRFPTITVSATTPSSGKICISAEVDDVYEDLAGVYYEYWDDYANSGRGDLPMTKSSATSYTATLSGMTNGRPYLITVYPYVKINGSIVTGKSFWSSASVSDVTPAVTFSILGDSYGTFAGYSLPSVYSSYENAGYEVYWYPKDNNNVTSWTQTWWGQLDNHPSYRLDTNNSWSGATVCETHYNTHPIESCFTRRTGVLGTPDIVFVCGGTNDAWSGADASGTSVKGFYGGLKTVFERVYANTSARIIFLHNNTVMGYEYNTYAIKACNDYWIEYIPLDLAGDQLVANHPNKAGMDSIYNKILELLSR